jgi:glycyl-tRNA synthetase (class II)
MIIYIMPSIDHMKRKREMAIDYHSQITLGSTYKKLRSVGVGSCVGHAEQTRFGVRDLEVLVRERPAIDGLATHTGAVCEVTSLAHEA